MASGDAEFSSGMHFILVHVYTMFSESQKAADVERERFKRWRVNK